MSRRTIKFSFRLPPIQCSLRTPTVPQGSLDDAQVGQFAMPTNTALENGAYRESTTSTSRDGEWNPEFKMHFV